MTTSKSTKNKRYEAFSFQTKFLMVFGAVAFVVFTSYFFNVRGSANYGVTLLSQPSIENGLIAHWTFDGRYVIASSSPYIVEPGEVVANDTFTETSDTAITSHTPETGGSYTTLIATGTCAMYVQGSTDDMHYTPTIGTGGCGADEGHLVRNGVMTDQKNVTVSATYERNPSSYGTAQMVWLACRIQDSDNMYVGGISDAAGSDRVAIFKKVGGTWTSLYNQTGNFLSYPVNLNFECNNSSLELLEDTSSLASVSDSSINTAGYVGFGVGELGMNASDFFDVNSQILDDFYAQEPDQENNFLAGYDAYDRVGDFTASTDADGNPPAVLSPGVIGQAANIDGNNAPYAGNVGSGIKSISFWIKADDNTSRKIFNIDGTDQIELNASGIVTATSFPGTTVVYVDGTSASASTVAGKWHHVVITDTTGVNATTFDIGRVSASYFDGLIDDVRLYNRVLSQEEITRLYRLGGTAEIGKTISSQSTIESGMEEHWTFDGGTVSKGPDSPTSSTGNTNPTSGIEKSGPGTIAWDNEGNILSSDDSRANSSSIGLLGETEYLQAKGFGFSIPTNAVILGIEVGIERYASGSSVIDSVVGLVNASDSIVGDNKADILNSYPTSSGTEAYATYGGSSDTWNAGLTAADINDSDFGVVLSVLNGAFSSRTAYVDHMRINIYYSVAGRNKMQSRISGLNASTSEAVFVPGAIGQGLRFDGVDDYARTDSGISSLGVSNQPYTISAWVKVASGETSGNIVHMSSVYDGGGWCLPPLAVSGGAFRAHSWNGGGVSATDPASYVQDRWYHVATTWDLTNGLRLWVDGRVVASTVQGSYSASGASNFLHFAFSPGACSGDTGYFAGSIDDVRVYSQSLGSDEMLRIYQLGATSRVNTTITSESSLDNGLVAHWTFDGKQIDLSVTSAEVRDRSTSALHGDGVNLSLKNGIIGQGLDLDSTTDEVNSGSTSVLDTDTHTIAFWLRNNDTAVGYDQIFAYKPSGSDRSPGIWRTPSGNCLHWRYDPGNTGTNCFGPSGENTYFSVGEWYHVAGVKSDATFAMYINGELVQSGISVADPKSSGSAAIELGATSGYGSAIVSVDDFRVYNRVLSAGDIRRLYQMGR